MPRNPGTGVYEQPAPDVITATTIESTVYNGFVNDVETDLNTPRPIVAGGTGATNATAARDNLSAEVRGVQVTNYNSHIFEAGSFWSGPGASGAPSGNSVSGTCDIRDVDFINLEARDFNTGLKYYRQKVARVWGAWISDKGTSDTDYVNAVGDTMTGDLVISKVIPCLTLNVPDTSAAAIYGKKNSVNRWAISPCTGADADFVIGRHNDVGTLLDYPLTILRNDATTTLTGNIVVKSGQVIVDAPSTVSQVILRNSATVTKGTFYISGDNVGITNSTAGMNLEVNSSGFVSAVRGIYDRNGATSGTYGVQVHNFYWTGSMQVWVTDVNVGNMTITSDYRIKKDIAPLPDMWQTVKALRPVKYTQAEFTPPGQMTMTHTAEGKTIDPVPMFAADDKERWGFVAHELQETMIEDAATGYKDAPDIVQSPNQFTLIAALTKALQEAMTRIEALEAAQAAP